MNPVPIRSDEPCPGCGGTLDIWLDGHAPDCRHPRRLLATPPPPVAVWAVLFRTDGGLYWMADTPQHVSAVIAAMDLSGDIASAAVAAVAGPN